jgi:hypothetical protein
MSLDLEDKDGAERWWKFLFCHGQNPALAHGCPWGFCVLCKKNVTIMKI